MNYTAKLLVLLGLLFFEVNVLMSQHYFSDEFKAYKADAYVIDGIADEAVWDSCEWYDIDKVWIPYGEVMGEGDFSGRVKIAWTEDKLLFYAEIEDDVLSDTHENPNDNYWNDDCFEVFIDEDYSGGWHEDNNNAFAYHCALNEEDAIDGAGNLKDHVEFDLDTIDNTHYVWELAFSLYDDTYVYGGSDNEAVTLSQNKEIGIAVAYCDNDGGAERENFIGLIDVDEVHFNSAWQDANVFGKLTLVGSDTVSNAIESINNVDDFVFIQDGNANFIIRNNGVKSIKTTISIVDLNGRIVKSTISNLNDEIMVNTNSLKKGFYILNVQGDGVSVSKSFIK